MAGSGRRFPVLGAMGRSTHDRLSLRHYIGGAVVSVWPGDPNIGGSLPRGRGRRGEKTWEGDSSFKDSAHPRRAIWGVSTPWRSTRLRY